MSAIILGAASTSVLEAVVTVSGENIAANSLTTAVAAVRFNSDGTVERGVNGVFLQIDAATDWVRPLTAAPGTYEIRLTVSSGNAPNTGGSAAVNTWLALTTPRLWELSNAAIGTSSGVWLIEIREGTGPVIDSGSYNMSATVDVP